MVLVVHGMALIHRLFVSAVAITKHASASTAIEVLLIMFVRIVKVDAHLKHVTDGMGCLLGAIIELPGRLGDGLFSKVLNKKSLHLGDIALTKSSETRFTTVEECFHL